MSPPTRRSEPHNRPASHQTPGKESDTPQGTPPPPDPEYADAVTDLAEVVTTAPQTEAEWAATLEAVETGRLDLDEVEFPDDRRPLAAIRSSRGGWKVFG